MKEDWQIVPNPAYEGRTPKPLQGACHDGTPFLTVRCACGEAMHLHESQIAGVPASAEVATRCQGCGTQIVFPPTFLPDAFAYTRASGWIEREQGP